MKLLPEPGPPPERDTLRARLQVYSRYAALVADQLAALDQGDLTRLQELAAERERVLRALTEVEGADPDAPGDDTVELRVEFPELLAQALRELADRTEAGLRLHERFQDLEGVTLRAFRGAQLRRSGRGQYWRGGPGQHRIDVRF